MVAVAVSAEGTFGLGDVYEVELGVIEVVPRNGASC